MDIGIIGGTGRQGFGLAKRLLNAGYSVRLGSRQELKGQEKAMLLSGKITGGTNEYASKAEMIILTIPADQIVTLLSPIKSNLENKLVIDNINNVVFGKTVRVEPFQGKSVYEFLLDFLDKSNVATAFKTISSVMLETDGELDQSDFIICDDDEAFELTSKISKDLGLEPIRITSAYHSETIERMVALSIQINKYYKKKHSGYKVVL